MMTHIASSHFVVSFFCAENGLLFLAPVFQVTEYSPSWGCESGMDTVCLGLALRYTIFGFHFVYGRGFEIISR